MHIPPQQIISHAYLLVCWTINTLVYFKFKNKDNVSLYKHSPNIILNLRPEILNCVEASNLNLTIFPTAIAFNFEEPEGPGVL